MSGTSAAGRFRWALYGCALTWLALTGTPRRGLAQDEPPTPEEQAAAEAAPLFAGSDMVALTLRTDVELLKDDRDDEREQPGVILYRAADGTDVELEVEVSVRGNFRREKRNCSFPPVRLDIPRSDADGTLFEGEDKLKLVTPCREGRSNYQDYVLKEYLVYRLFNVLDDRSFRVRLLDLTYEDTSGNDPLQVHAFIIEDDERLAQRLGGIRGDFERIHPLGLQNEYSALVALFEYMIGNTDFDQIVLHNVELIRTPDLSYLPVPYDFDFSGLVDARYASPDPQFPIRSVRERLYRGYCRPDVDLGALVQRFNEGRPAMEALVSGVPGLSDGARDDVLSYLGEFFDIVNTPARFRREIEEACWAMPG